MSDEDAAKRPAPDKWSAKEIVGHLIDSAVNNHIRFVTAGQKDNLVFNGYDQAFWVTSQGYANADWTALISLWEAYNLRLASVMNLIPEETRLARHGVHNLHQIAWVTVPEGSEATLDYLMADYVDHVQHHLAQILT